MTSLSIHKITCLQQMTIQFQFQLDLQVSILASCIEKISERIARILPSLFVKDPLKVQFTGHTLKFNLTYFRQTLED